MMYEQRDAVQNTEGSSAGTLGMLSSVCVRILTQTHSRLVIYKVTRGECSISCVPL